MFNNFLFYLRLTWLCFKLFLNLIGFGLSFLLKKINKNAFLEMSLLVLILLSAILNFWLFEKRNTPKINLKEAEVFTISNQESLPLKTILKNEGVREKLDYYQKLDKDKIKNLGLFLNLSQLYEIEKSRELSKKYLDLAQEIEPKINKLITK